MKIKEIEAFIAVVEEGGIVNAAEKLFCVPSNISKLINELESRNEQPLFNRDRRELNITPYGRYFYEQAQKLINSIDDFKEKTLQSKEAKLIVGGLDIALDYFLPKYICDYQIDNKNVSFEVYRGYSITLETMISNNEYDLVFSDGPLNSPRLNSKLVFLESLVLTGHLENKEFPIIYSYGNQCTYREYIEQWAKSNFNNFKIIEIESYPLMLNFIENGMGISFIPSSVVQQYPKFEHLVDPTVFIECNIYMIWHKFNQSKALSEFVSYFSEFYDKQIAKK